MIVAIIRWRNQRREENRMPFARVFHKPLVLQLLPCIIAIDTVP